MSSATATESDREVDAQALKVLQDVFGFSAFRGRQAEIIRAVTSGRDAFALMPTGAGKSLCYQIPAILRDGLGVVVSPLIALMEDQVAALRENGVRAAMLNSSLSARDQQSVAQDVRAGRLDLLYIAPERLLGEQALSLLGEVKLSLIAIDEAHCVSQWGHDFRPEYMGLSSLKSLFPDVPRIVLTATADERTRQEIVDRLELQDAAMFRAGFDRPNIRYQVVVKDNSKQQLLTFLEQEHPLDSGIVYCLSRKKTEEVADWLNQSGRRALPYHAGMDADQRRKNQARFLREEEMIMVATIAFGMGIDKPDVRFVAHLDLPKSIEAYYQETGRAGRDGLPADAWMAYGQGDAVTHRRFIDLSEADEAHKRIERSKLNALLGLCETTKCRRQVLLGYFGDALPDPCNNCDTCLNPVKSFDGTLLARKALYLVGATGQRFGAQHLIGILIGRNSDRMVSFGHDKLSAFGKGTELSSTEWGSVFRQLISMGYLNADQDAYGGLKLTDDSRAVLENRAVVNLRRDPPKSRSRRHQREASTKSDLSIGEQKIFDALRAKRREIAQEHGVPPYVIFHDTTLKTIAQCKPSTLAEMRGISGMGERKLEAYGSDFLEVVVAEVRALEAVAVSS